MGPAEYFELSLDDGRATGGERPTALLEPWPQGKLQRHAGIGYEIVQGLDVPVPQMGEQLPDIVAGGCRAGYRSAKDLASRCSSATFASRHAVGGTVGGSADDSFLFLVTADCGAPRRHSSSWS